MSPAKGIVERPLAQTRGRAPSQPYGLPTWFETTLAILLCVLLGFSLTGLPLAMLGWFSPIPVVVGTSALGGALLGLWKRSGDARARSARAPGGSGAVWALVALVVLSTGVNLTFSSEHLLANRDAGVYVSTARWLADEGTLLIDAARGPYEDVEARLATQGYYETRERGKLHAQFLHLFPATLAAGAWLGDSWLLVRTNAVFGGIALLMVFAFASRMMRPWFAFATAAVLGLGLPQVHFSRDAYTEILTQVFLFGGLWVLWEARSRLDQGRAVLAGLLIGATCMVRVDSFAYLIPLGVYLVYELWSASGLSPDMRRARRRVVVAFGSAAAIPVVIGMLDGVLYSRGYLRDLRSSLLFMVVGVAAVVVGGAFVLAARPVVRLWVRFITRHRRTLAGLGVVLVVGGVMYALVGRPHLEYSTGGFSAYTHDLQLREGLDLDPRRAYSEMSMWWLWWYLGPLLLVGVLGVARAVWRTAHGLERRLLPFLLIFSMMTAIYLWRPSITPDQVWAMRRFLPVTIPGLLLLAFWFADGLWGWRDRFKAVARIVTVAVVIGGFASSIWTLAPVWQGRAQEGLLEVSEQLCGAMPEDAAVVILDRGAMARVFPQTVRSFCRVPVAIAPEGEPAWWLEEVARHQDERGGQVVVVSPDGEPFLVGEVAVTAELLLTASWEIPERRLSGRPRGYEPETFTVHMTVLHGPTQEP